MLVKRKLGSNANKYIQDALSFDSVLCRCLLDVVEFKKEVIDIYAFLPSNFDPTKTIDFKTGGVYPKAVSYLPGHLLEKYGNNRDVLFLFDDVMSSPSDKYLLGEVDSTVFSIGSEVYHFCNSDTISEKSLDKLIWACGVSWHFICIVLKGETADLIADKSGEVLCVNIKDNLREIVIGAFDGEGFIHCFINS
jgi:hypothetical protein